jgi:peptidoglycan/LPS O-acetylase OafA/YrhL
MTRPLAATTQERVRGLLGGHILTLDGVRGMAILMVLAHNLKVLTGPQTSAGHAIDFLDDLGWVGVQLFFVLSGFLITGILLDTRESDNYYRAFLGRRVLRIFPLYYGTLFVAFVVLPLVSSHHPPPDGQLWLWTYTSNWTAPFGHDNPEFPHFWSLAVEEQFYFLWPLVVRVLSHRRLLQVCIGIAVASLGFRLWMRLAGMGPQPVYMWTICRMDALALGAAVATVLRMPRLSELAQRRAREIALGGLALALAGFFFTRGDPRTTGRSQTIGYSILAIAFASLVFTGVMVEARRSGLVYRVLAWRPLRALGIYSYGMYVFHVPIHRAIGLPILRRWIPEDEPVGAKIGLAYFLVTGAASLLAAMASYHLIEKRFLALKRYFTPSRTKLTESAPPPPPPPP